MSDVANLVPLVDEAEEQAQAGNAAPLGESVSGPVVEVPGGETYEVPIPNSARFRLAVLLEARRQADREIAAFAAGVLAGLGLSIDSLEGLNEDRQVIVVRR